MIPALDAPSVYSVPLQYHGEGLDAEELRAFASWTSVSAPRCIKSRRRWPFIESSLEQLLQVVRIGTNGVFGHEGDG